MVAELQALIRSYRLGDQSSHFRPPAWDLNVILHHLSSKAYEPLAQTNFEHVTLKSLFLLALATAARISEIHVLDIDSVCFE